MSQRRKQLLIPVHKGPSDHEHSMKYIILNEVPVEYICDKGCIHKYPHPPLERSSMESQWFGKNSFQEMQTKPDTTAVYKYYNSGKVQLLKKESPLRTLPNENSVALFKKSSPITTPIMFPENTTPSLTQEAIQTDPPENMTLTKQRSPLLVRANREANQLAQRPRSAERLLREYDKAESNVFQRLYPYRGKSNSSEKNERRLQENVYIEPYDATEALEKSEVKKPSAGFETTRFRRTLSPAPSIGSKGYSDTTTDVFKRLYPQKPDPKKMNSTDKRVAVKMDWKNYHRLDTIYRFMDELENEFPSLCTVGTVGQSVERRAIKLLKISNGNASNVAVWLDAGIHAREWIGPAVNTFIADYIARNFDRLPNSCKNKDWYFMPVVNPDGYEYSHTKFRMWRKNRAWHGNKCCGVDINRNFSVAWGGKGSSGDPDHSFFRGSGPFSEPEACAMKAVLMDANLPFKVYLTLHAYGEVIIMPFAHADDLCPDYVRLLHGATVMSRAIYNTNGTIYKVGVSKDVMYRASGTSNDWCYGAVGIPWCYLLELRSRKHKFKCPEEEINQTGNEILNCVLALMDHVDKHPREQNAGDYVPSNKKIPPIKLNINKVAPATVRRPTQVWEVRLVNEGHRLFVKALDTAGVINIWKEEPGTMDVMVHGPKIPQLSGLLIQREIPYSIAVPDVGYLLQRERPCITRGCNSCNRQITSKASAQMNWTSYHDLESIYKFMKNLSEQYPYLVTLIPIGKTVENREILVLKISNGNTGNLGVWVDGGIHAREWVSPAVVTYLANNLIRTFQDQPSSVTNKDWYILPVVNPDGYVYTRTTDRMWRKNRNRYGECIGVDLNRNFSEGWGEQGEEGSSEDPGNIFYRGPHAFSEPETAAVRDTIENASCKFIAFLSFHSFGEVVIFPWGYTSDPCPTYVELLEGGTCMAKAIFQKTGHTYKVGSTKDLMYYASGTSVDWSYSYGIPYSYMIELRGKQYRFLLPHEEILPTAEEVYSAVISLMNFVDHRHKSTQSHK